MYTQPRTSTITRRTIKRVENRLKGFSGIIEDVFGSSSTTPPISGTSTNQQIGWDDFLGMLRGGQLKIDATQFAEGMNRLFFCMEPGCTNPVPNIPVVPNNPTPRFGATSVAGMIERCRINEARNGLSYISSEFQRRMSSASDPMAPYIKRWWDEYGRNNVSSLNAIIANAAGTCGLVGEVPKVCTAPQIWCTSKLRCTHPEECSAGGISTTMVIGIAAVFALMMFMRR